MNQDFELIFRTRAELQGARQVEEQLQRDIGKAKALGQEYSELEKKLKQVQLVIGASKPPAGPGLAEFFGKIREGLGDVVPGFAKLDGILSKFGGGALGGIAGGFATLAASLETAKHSIEEFANAEAHVNRLDAALSQAGLLTNEYREQLQDLAEELQHTTGIAGEEWLGVLTKLTQFGADSTNIDEVTAAVKNLAGILGGDLQSASLLVSRALQGNFQMFSRYGIVVEESGTQAEKLDALFRQLALRGAGQLEAATKGLSGRFQDLKNNTADLFKAIGHGIADTGVLQFAIQLASDASASWAERLGGTIPKVAGLGNAAVSTKQTIEESVPSDRFKKALEAINRAAADATEKLKGLQDQASALKSAQDAIAEAQKEVALADIEARVSSGKISRSQGDLEKGVVEARSIQGSAARQRDFLLEQDRLQGGAMNAADYAAHVAGNALAAKQAEAQRAAEAAPFRDRAAVDKAAVENARARQREIEVEWKKPVESWGQAGRREAMWEQYDQLNHMLPNLQKVAEASQAKAASFGTVKAPTPDELATLKQRAEDTAAAAATAKIVYGSQRAVTQTQLDALGQTTGLRLTQNELRTGTQLIGDQSQADKDASQQRELSQREQSLGLSGTVAKISPNVLQAGDQVAKAIEQVGGSIDTSMGGILQSVQALLARMKTLENRVNSNNQF